MKLFSWKRLVRAISQPQRLFGIVVIIPFLLSVIYFTFFAVDRYVSSAQVVVRQIDSRGSQAAAGLAILTGGVDPASREYTLYLKEYIGSYDMLNYLEESLNWSEHYSSQYSDPFFYLTEGALTEEKLKFYNKMITTHYDDMTGLLHIDAQALTGEFSEQVVQEILVRSKFFINSVSRDMALEQSKFANTELLASTQRYQQSKDEMQAFQNLHKLLDADATAQSMLEIISSLESEIAKENARLKALESTLAKNAPQIKALNNKISSLKEQLKIEKSRITATSDIDGSFNAIASEYRQLQVNIIVAEEFYKTSLAIVENAKLEAIKNVRSLIAVVKPIKPQEAIYPQKIYNLLTIIIVLCLLYGILRFVIASIKDHYE